MMYRRFLAFFIPSPDYPSGQTWSGSSVRTKGDGPDPPRLLSPRHTSRGIQLDRGRLVRTTLVAGSDPNAIVAHPKVRFQTHHRWSGPPTPRVQSSVLREYQLLFSPLDLMC